MMSRFTLAVILAVSGFFVAQSSGNAQSGLGAYQTPISYSNVSVSFVHGKGDGKPSPLSLNEAVSRKMAQVHLSPNEKVIIDNFSDQEVFIQAGDIVIGGFQDQVAGTSLIVPPRSTGTEIAIFCVERGRSDVREAEKGAPFRISSTVIPSDVAQASLASKSVQTGLARQVRQFGVWLGIESLRTRLSEQVGGSIASDKSPTSLPLALENKQLDAMLRPYIDALQALPDKDNDVVGVTFAIDGRVVAADVYSSNALFRQMWPKLLRAHAIRAVAARSKLYEASRMEGSGSTIATMDRREGRLVHAGYLDRSEIPLTALEQAVFSALTSPSLKTLSTSKIDELDLLKQLMRRVSEQDPAHFNQALQQALAAGLFYSQPDIEKAVRQAFAQNKLGTYDDLRTEMDRAYLAARVEEFDAQQLLNIRPDPTGGDVLHRYVNNTESDAVTARTSLAVKIVLGLCAAVSIMALLWVAFPMARKLMQDRRLLRERFVLVRDRSEIGIAGVNRSDLAGAKGYFPAAGISPRALPRNRKVPLRTTASACGRLPLVARSGVGKAGEALLRHVTGGFAALLPSRAGTFAMFNLASPAAVPAHRPPPA
jgi:hypothetical protein